MKTETEQNITDKKASKLKYIIAAVCVFLLVIGVFAFAIFRWEPKPDPASERTIRKAAAKQLDKDPNDLTDEDFTNITSFAIGKVGLPPDFLDPPILIADIKLLEKFTNLETLYFDNLKYPEKAIPKWKQFLVQMGILKLPEKPKIDLKPLQKLSNLKELTIRRSEIQNIKPISRLHNLENLNLDGNLVSDIKPLKELTNLQTLYLSSVQVSDIEPLQGLTNLQSFTLASIQITNIEPIGKLLNLKTLHLQDVPVLDITPIKELKKLRTLSISRCKDITDKQLRDLLKDMPQLSIRRDSQPFTYFNPRIE